MRIGKICGGRIEKNGERIAGLWKGMKRIISIKHYDGEDNAMIEYEDRRKIYTMEKFVEEESTK